MNIDVDLQTLLQENASLRGTIQELQQQLRLAEDRSQKHTQTDEHQASAFDSGRSENDDLSLQTMVQQDEEKDMKSITNHSPLVLHPSLKLEVCGEDDKTSVRDLGVKVDDFVDSNIKLEPSEMSFNTQKQEDAVKLEPPDTQPHLVVEESSELANQNDRIVAVAFPSDICQSNSSAKSPDQPPKKRRRLILEVVLPPPRHQTLRTSLSTKAKTESLGNTELAALENGNYKIKKDFSLNDVTVYDRLKEIGLDIYPVSIEDDIKNLIVPRIFLSNIYGGGTMQTFARIDQKKSKRHGFDNFLYLPPNYHPYAPKLPGAPGIFLTPSTKPIPDVLYRTIVRVQDVPALWLYCGQYKLKKSKSLGAQEWIMQSTPTRKIWMKRIHNEPFGSSVCARVALRRVLKGREPTEKEIEEYVKRPDFKAKLKPSEEEINTAFEKGEEKLRVWTMQCRGYDEAFAKSIAHKYAIWKSQKVDEGSDGRNWEKDIGFSMKHRLRKANKRTRDDEDDDYCGDGESDVDYQSK